MRRLAVACVALTVAVVIGAFAYPGAETASPLPGTGPNEGGPGTAEFPAPDEYRMPDLSVSWLLVDTDVVVTVVRSDPERLLDCRWAANVLIGETLHSGIINLTDYDPPTDLTKWEGPGCPAMGYRHDPNLAFLDVDEDDRMSVGDQWIIHHVENGMEVDLVMYLQYWSVWQVYKFVWQGPDPLI